MPKFKLSPAAMKAVPKSAPARKPKTSPKGQRNKYPMDDLFPNPMTPAPTKTPATPKAPSMPPPTAPTKVTVMPITSMPKRKLRSY